MRNGGRLLVESLVALGARKGFGVPGESYLAVLDALHDTAGRLDYVLCRHEGGASFMAAAWGKLTGQPGICFVTRGPGATNASIGVHTAMQDSVPMILFIGHVATTQIGREAFQEIDYRAMFGGIAKWVVQIDHADRIPEILSRAWSTALSGRPGPVVIALPEDMLMSQAQADPLIAPPRIEAPAPTQGAMAEAMDLLRGARRPLILMGGTNWPGRARKHLRDFAESSQIPVVAAFRYQDMFDNASDVFAGEAGVGMIPHVKGLIRDADVILALNIRFGEMTTDAWQLLDVPRAKQRIVHVHPSADELGKIYIPDIGIQSGTEPFAAGLRPIDGPWKDWTRAARDGFVQSFDAPAQPSPVDMVAVMRHLRDILPDDAVLTNGAGNFAVWPNKFFAFTGSQRLLAPQSGAMGYGLPAAIAAKIEKPDRIAICFAGDGDFQMNCPELGTAMQMGACPIVLVLNNGTYGTIRAHQERNFPGRISGTELSNPDFSALARAYGLHAERVERTEDFAEAFARALASRTGAVLDLSIAAEALTPRQTLSQMRNAALNKIT